MNNRKRIPLINKIPLTRFKLSCARFCYNLIKLFIRDNNRIISRRGIRYQVDLSEGIDLSLFLFSGFQSAITGSSLLQFPQDAVIFDIGANIGSMTLKFAQLAPSGQVYAFEPTNYAFAKLKTNLSLNPALSSRVMPIQVFVSEQCAQHSSLQAYASWKIDAKNDAAHPLHGGILKSDTEAQAVPSITLDAFCEDRHINRLDFIKIDTDGHELKVLKGAARTIERFRPVIVFEAGLYVLDEQHVDFGEFCTLFSRHGYALYNIPNNRQITIDNYWKYIPMRNTTDVIAVPLKKSSQEIHQG